MIKMLILVLLSFVSNSIYADDKWPIKVADIGCTFEYKEFYGSDEPQIVEVIEVLPFPEIRIQNNSDRDPKNPLRPLLSEIEGVKLEDLKRGKTKNLFCDCSENEGLDNLFPLSVGKRLVWEGDTSFNNVFEVVKYRESPYFEDTSEYLIEFSTPADFSYYPRFGPKFRMWWNVELGFYTEKETPRHMAGMKFKSTNCAPDKK